MGSITSIEVLISTMFLDDPILLLKKMNIASNAIIVDQCNTNHYSEFDYMGHNIVHISTTDRGLSKSRNLALKHSSGDILIIADDDFRYSDNYSDRLIDEYKKMPMADIIIFNATKSDGNTYQLLHKKVNKLEMYKINSIRITFRRKSIIDNSIFFNENFGAGTYINMGEDNLFIDSCKKNRLLIFSSNYILCESIDYRPSTWFTGYNCEYFYKLGVFYRYLSPRFYILMILYFALTKIRLYRRQVSTTSAIHNMLKGAREWRKLVL